MFESKNNRVMVLAPHTDDGELGCGGTIARFMEEGYQVHYAAFSTARESVPDGLPKDILEVEVREATKRLGILPGHLLVYSFTVRKLNYVRQEILEELVRIRREVDPGIVFLPSDSDLHQDHYTVALEGQRAFKGATMLAYELPWNNITFKSEGFVRLEERHIDKKIEAIGAYQSQAGKPYTTAEYLRSHAHMRGVQIGTRYAECFEVVRLVV